MNRSRRSVAVLMSILMTMTLLFSGCGDNASVSSSNSQQQSNGDKPVELIWYSVGPANKDHSMVMEEVNKYLVEKINATINMKVIEFGDYTQKMQVMVAAGEPMDILFTCSWAFDYVTNARKGAFKPLDDLLPNQGKDVMNILDSAFIEGTKVDGHNYAIPANKEYAAQEVYRFNKEFLDKYNLDISNVKQLEDIVPMLKVIKENEPGVQPYLMTKEFMPVMPFDYIIEKMPLAVYLDTDDYKIVNILETPEAMKTLQNVHAMYKEGYISAEASTTTNIESNLKSGNWFADRASAVPFADNLWSAMQGYPIVSVPANKPMTYNWSVMGSLQAISANSKHPEKAMEFLNLLNTDPKLRNMLDAGLEGVHYEMVQDNMRKKLDRASDYKMPSFALGNVMITHLNVGDPENKWEAYKEFNAAAENAPLLGFNFDATKVSTELASVLNVKDEFWAPLMTGTVDPTVYMPKAVAKFKAAGLDKVMEEAQRQLDEWKAVAGK